MTQIITRLYESHANATAAAAELREIGFDESAIAVVAPMPDASHEEITATIMRGYVWKPYAKLYAERVKRGASLVSVMATFGQGVAATEALEAHGGADAGIEPPIERGPIWDEAAPLSSALQMPVRSSNPTPLSTVLGLPVLACDGASSEFLGLPQLADGGVPYEPSFPLPLPLLSDNPAPLSSKLGLPLLSNKAAPFSSMFGLPVLTRS